MSVRLDLATINVPREVGPAGWRDCIEKTAERASLFGVQESFTEEQHAAFLKEARRHGLRQFGLKRGPNPVFSDPKVWRRLHGSVHQLHGRGPNYDDYPGFNEARYATVTVYEAVHGGSPDVTVINAHLVPRGPKVPEEWRNRVRKQSIRKLNALVQEHLAHGRIVIILGDFNMDEAPRLEDVVWIAGAHHGVDKIGIAVPAGWRIASHESVNYRADTDHKHGTSAVVEIERVHR